MNKDKKVISVFIASPGDLSSERDLFRQTVETLNGGFGDGYNVIFDPKGWEDSLAVTGRRNQSIINDVLIQCDVFILALGSRWGQPAPDSEYSSYTEEEYFVALEQFKSTGKPEIFVFCKNIDPERAADPGPQLQKVLAFRQMLEDTKKCLYRNFSDDNSFCSEVDLHLRAYARNELPAFEEISEPPMLPVDVIQEIKAAKKEAAAASLRAIAAENEVELSSARALEFAFQTAEDAAEAALEGKLEKAGQRFASVVADTTNVKILELAFEFYFRTGEYETAMNIAKRWQAVATPNSTDQANAYGNIGVLHLQLDKLDQAEKMLNRALTINKELNFKEGMAITYGNLGNIHTKRNELNMAIEMHQKALVIDIELENKIGVARHFGNMGLAHKELGDKDEAIVMFRSALDLDTELGNKEGIARHCGNIGLLHLENENFPQAMVMLEKSVALEEALGHKAGMSCDYANIGFIHEALGDLNRAEFMLNKSLAIEIQLGREIETACRYEVLARIHMKLNNINEFEHNAQRALNLFERLSLDEEAARCSSNLGLIHVERTELDSAEAMFLKSLTYQNKLYRTEYFARTTLNLANVYMLKNNIDAAEKMLQEALSMFVELGLKDDINYCHYNLKNLKKI